MNSRRFSIIFFVLGFAIIFLTSLFKLPIDHPLAGAEQEIPRPPLSLHRWFDGSFASEVDPWLTRKFGFRGIVIRIAHQLDWILFRQLPSPGGTPIDVGFDHWLYEHEYVRHHVKRFPMVESKAQLFASNLSRFHAYLASNNVPLVVCMTPSKAALYPEHLPDIMQPTGKYLLNTPARDTMRRVLEDANIPFVDCHDLLLSWKTNGAPLLFTKNGTHWNAYAAQLTLNHILNMARLQNPSLPHPPPITGFVLESPLIADRDLSSLYNMIWYPFSESSVPYPVLDLSLPTQKQLRIVGIGDSFSFQLADAMGRTPLISNFCLLYYNKAEYVFSWQSQNRPSWNDPQKFRIDAIDPKMRYLQVATNNCDLFILEFNEVFAHTCAWGLFEE